MRRGAKWDERDLQALIAEEAHRVGDVIAGVADSARNSDPHLLGSR
jgi:hypothetical protein